MTKRTRLFLFISAGILFLGLGTGLVASYVANQNLIVIGADGPDELAYVPATVHMVAYADVREIMTSELHQKISQFIGHDPGPDAKTFQEQTGIDIQHDVDHIVAAATPDMMQGPPLVLARGVFDAVRIEGLIRAKGGAVEDYKGIRLLTHPESNTAVAFVEPDLAAAGSAAAVRAAIDAKTSGDNVRDNAELMRLIKDSDGNGNVWAVTRFDALAGAGKLPPELASQLPAINWFAASGRIDSGLSGVVRAETRDEVAAQDLRQVLQGFLALARMQSRQRPEFADLLNSFQLGGTGTTVSFEFSVGPNLIDALGAVAARQRQAPRQPAPSAPSPDGAPQQPTL